MQKMLSDRNWVDVYRLDADADADAEAPGLMDELNRLQVLYVRNRIEALTELHQLHSEGEDIRQEIETTQCFF